MFRKSWVRDYEKFYGKYSLDHPSRTPFSGRQRQIPLTPASYPLSRHPRGAVGQRTQGFSAAEISGHFHL